MKNIAVLISNKGTGTNLQAIIDNIEKGSIKGQISVVISNTSKAYGLKRAEKNGITFEVVGWRKYKELGKSREEYSKDLARLLKEKYRVDLVALAGWSLILTKEFFNIFQNKVLNVHPGILPKEGNENLSPVGETLPTNVGLMTDEAIKKFVYGGYKYAGSTLHFATEEADAGPVIFHEFEKIRTGDTVDSLYTRLKKREHAMFIKAIRLFCENKINVEVSEVNILQ